MSRSLCLNISYQPLGFLTQDRAVCIVLDDKAEILEHDDWEYRSSSGITVPAPLVVRLNRYVPVPTDVREAVTSRVLFARDKHTCQYCGTHASKLKKGNRLTIDHVLPKSKGGRHDWENVVTSCYHCNLRKRDRTPLEANMKFVHLYKDRAPKKPSSLMFTWGGKVVDKQRKWVEYYYGPMDIDVG